jgi:hypothetical protein
MIEHSHHNYNKQTNIQHNTTFHTKSKQHFLIELLITLFASSTPFCFLSFFPFFSCFTLTHSLEWTNEWSTSQNEQNDKIDWLIKCITKSTPNDLSVLFITVVLVVMLTVFCILLSLTVELIHCDIHFISFIHTVCFYTRCWSNESDKVCETETQRQRQTKWRCMTWFQVNLQLWLSMKLIIQQHSFVRSTLFNFVLSLTSHSHSHQTTQSMNKHTHTDQQMHTTTIQQHMTTYNNTRHTTTNTFNQALHFAHFCSVLLYSLSLSYLTLYSVLLSLSVFLLVTESVRVSEHKSE